jgi:hypothetical protein
MYYASYDAYYEGLAADYYFDNILEENNVNLAGIRRVKRSFAALMELLQLCLVTTHNVDGKAPSPAQRRRIKSLRVRTIKLLCLVELGTPKTFFAKYMHELLHVVGDCIPRWGSARNFWSFFPERYLYMYMYMYTRAKTTNI